MWVFEKKKLIDELILMILDIFFIFNKGLYIYM